jgi:hypothetical protein
MAAPTATSAAMIVVMTVMIDMSVTTPKRRKAQTKFRLRIYRGGININRLLVDVNRLRAGVNRLLINANGLLINVNRLICGLKRDTDTEAIFAAPISRY